MGCDDFEGFSEVAREHAVHPRTHGPIMDFDGYARITGPCGDTMEFWLTVQNGKLDRVSFITNGCGCSLACGSMAASMAEGKSIQDAAALKQADILDALGGVSSEFEHCALLAANTLKAACEDYWKRPEKILMGSAENKETKQMKIAVPLADGKLTERLGRCERFAFVDVNPAERKILRREDIDAPPHKPGILFPWVAKRGASVIIAGGISRRARGLFTEQGIRVIVGAPVATPERLVSEYLAGTLQAG
jgi:nitrogen fixation NifU-like protein